MTGETFPYDQSYDKKMEFNLIKLSKIYEGIIETNGTDISKIEELEEFSYNLVWEKVFEYKWIAESDILFWTLEYFIKKGDDEKCDYLAWMLNTYYQGFIAKKFNELITLEEYELCSKIKKYL